MRLSMSWCYCCRRFQASPKYTTQPWLLMGKMQGKQWVLETKYLHQFSLAQNYYSCNLTCQRSIGTIPHRCHHLQCRWKYCQTLVRRRPALWTRSQWIAGPEQSFLSHSGLFSKRSMCLCLSRLLSWFCQHQHLNCSWMCPNRQFLDIKHHLRFWPVM